MAIRLVVRSSAEAGQLGRVGVRPTSRRRSVELDDAATDRRGGAARQARGDIAIP